jgi:4-amino-4-deoxy-L-arabinose transferase-like glycosyltransferase
MFPPLYPLLIAAASFFTPNFHIAAQLVSLIAGISLILAIFGIARSLYGDKAACLAAGLAAIHPLLIMLSTTAWVEGLYIALITMGAYYANRAQLTNIIWDWILTGTLLGLAYLTAPQAIIFPILYLSALFVIGYPKKLVTPGKAAALIGSFILVALPYVIFLSLSFGELKIEGKTVINNEIGGKLLQGIPEKISGFEVTENLEENGVWMQPNLEVAKKSHSTGGYGNTLKLMFTKGFSNLQTVIENLSVKPFFGGPLLLPLVVLGLLRSPWDWHRAKSEAILLLTVAGSALAMTTIIYMFDTRYYYILIPFLTIWAAKGILELGEWAEKTLEQLHFPKLTPQIAGKVTAQIMTFGMMLIFSAGLVKTTKSFQLQPEFSLRRTAGEWIEATFPVAITIMDYDPATSFHANGKYIHFPYCDEHTALKYAEKKKVNFIILKSMIEADDINPYHNKWLKDGIPSPSIHLINTFSDKESRLLVYKINNPEPY